MSTYPAVTSQAPGPFRQQPKRPVETDDTESSTYSPCDPDLAAARKAAGSTLSACDKALDQACDT